MTLDEAIKHCEEVAQAKEKEGSLNQESFMPLDDFMKYRVDCLECASEHRQLAKWLRELKAYRVNMRAYQMDLNARFEDAVKGDGYQNGIGTACDLFDSYLEEVNADG